MRGAWFRRDKQAASARLCVLFGFFPFLALPVGASSNVPLACIAALPLLFMTHQPRALVAYAMVVAPPVVAAPIQLFVHVDQAPSLKGMLVLAVLAVPVFAIGNFVGQRGPQALLLPLRVGLIASTLYAGYQYVQMQRGVVPFFLVRSLSGYPDLQKEVGVQKLLYAGRPFGWFPEPSFLAGTLILACACLILGEQFLRRTSSPLTYAVTAFSMAGVFLTQSGAGLLGIPLLLLLLVRPRLTRASSTLLWAGSTVVLIPLLQRLLVKRTSGTGFSWADRTASLVGALRYDLATAGRTTVGVGRDHMAELYSQHAVPAEGLARGYYPRGVYSAIGRLIVEGGLVFGLLPVLVASLLLYVCISRALGRSAGILLLVTWILVALVTISYDSAVLIWVLLGLAAGLGGCAPAPRTQGDVEIQGGPPVAPRPPVDSHVEARPLVGSSARSDAEDGGGKCTSFTSSTKQRPVALRP